MIELWETILYEPLYNALIVVSGVLPGADVGLGVIFLTILVRIILLPLSKKMIKSQFLMRRIAPKLQAIKAQKLSKEEEAQKTFALYKEEKINPFSGCLLLLIQIPILIALYLVFSRPILQPEFLYPFVSPEGLSTLLFGIIDITQPLFIFALLAGVVQSIQAFLTPQTLPSSDEGFQAQIAKSMVFQTRYVLPIIIIVIASRLSAAVSLYWVIGGLFSIAQELYFRKKFALAYPESPQ